MAKSKYLTLGQVLALMEAAVDAGFTYSKLYANTITFGELVELKTKYTKCKLYGFKVFNNGNFLTWVRICKVPVKGWFLLDVEFDESDDGDEPIVVVPWSLKTDVTKTTFFANHAGEWTGQLVVKILKLFTDAEAKKSV